MAAKVVMVAVPTVLGLASIRVYTVSEAPDGLVTREKLNIYTPVPQSAQVQCLPEKPGVLEGGLTTARERMVPFVQAVTGACFSVKTGSVNLYHAGEDAYYYLKDPPPGFLPRFGTITMAGLLGMVLARKGSRFKQLAVPLGLMCAGASVCYPAQTVAVLKVTGKKVFAAGQWSSAAVSSLLAPKPLDHVDKEITPSQPQSSTEFAIVKDPLESSSAQRATISEPETESAVSFPGEPSVGDITEEPSLVTIADFPSDQTPTDANTASSKTETTTTPHDNDESSGIDQAPKEVPPEAESSLRFEPETASSAPSTEETLAPRSSDEPAGGSSFKADPSLMDFGQSSPEDEDLYSTRS